MRSGHPRLDLSGLGLVRLPRRLSNLTNLQVLDLGANELKTLPHHLGKLRSLRTLELGGNRLTGLPADLRHLTNLHTLRLVGNRLTRLPAELSELSNLHTLDLWRNRLTELPTELGQLSNLQHLDLGDNRLTVLPGGLGQLTNLQTLRLPRNRLTQLPAELGQLSNLQLLEVGDNRLTRLPAELGQLTNLRALELWRNRLTELPAELGQLTNLQRLGLSNNCLTELPTQLGQLARLQALDLAGNDLKELPGHLGELTKLQELDLWRNQLTDLPAQLGQLSGLQRLELVRNPLEAPLPELVHQGVSAVLAYLRSLADATPRYEAKLVLVGTSRVGKSSLLARLRGEGFDPDRDSTHGINLDRLVVDHPDRPVKITLNTWDSGGQEIYQLTHQVFYSTQALYVLVWHPGQAGEPAAVERWLDRIGLQVGEQARVLVVASHADDYQPRLDQEWLRARYGAILGGFYQVDSRSGRGVVQILDAIAVQAAELLPAEGELLSERWVGTRTALRARSELQVSYGEYVRVCAAHEITDQDAVDALLGLLHTRGLVLHYGNDPSLWDLVVLQPEWLTGAISQVLDDQETRNAGGVLEHSRLQEIWQTGPDGTPYDHRARRYLLSLMWRFAVAYQLEDRDASLVTQLVPALAPPLAWSHDSTPAPGWRAQSLIWQLDQPAPGLLAQLTVKTHLYATGLYWQSGVSLQPAQQPGTQALITLDTDDPRQLQLTVHSAVPTLLVGELVAIVRQLLAARWKGLTYREQLRCPTILDNDVPCVGLFDLAAIHQQLGEADPGLECEHCGVVWSGAALLAGWQGPPGVQPRPGKLAAPVGHPSSDAITEERLAGLLQSAILAGNQSLHDKLDQQAGTLGDIGQRISRVQNSQAHELLTLRTLLQITMDHYREGTARPKLFTLVPINGGLAGLQDMVRTKLELTLWCADQRGAHPQQTYTVTRTAGWLRKLAPYLRVASAALAMAAGVGPAAVTVALPTLDPTTIAKVDLTAKLAEQLLPKRGQPRRRQDPLDPIMTDTPRIADDALLRMVNELIDTADPDGDYGGLRLRLAASGLLWVCPVHAADYDTPSRSHELPLPGQLIRADPSESSQRHDRHP